MPVEGERKFQPIKAHGIRDWLEAGQKAGIPFFSESKAQELIMRNEQKGDRLKQYKLPQFETYGPAHSFEEVAKLIPEQKRTKSDRFLVRCAPKDKSSALKIERTKNIFWEDVETFIAQLPGGSSQYTVEVREHWEPKFSGTIRGEGNGIVTIEVWRGSHADGEHRGLGSIKVASIDTESFDKRNFSYEGDPSPQQKEIMMGALRYLVPHLTRERLRQLQIHAEFVYHKDRGYKFIDVEDDPFWIKFASTPTKDKPVPLSGD